MLTNEEVSAVCTKVLEESAATREDVRSMREAFSAHVADDLEMLALTRATAAAATSVDLFLRGDLSKPKEPGMAARLSAVETQLAERGLNKRAVIAAAAAVLVGMITASSACAAAVVHLLHP